MKLVDLDPEWWTITDGRTGMGITFLCPHCNTQYLGVWFANPTDGGTPAPPDCFPIPRWNRVGDTFETLTLHPSINVENHWHGFIINGEITNA